MGRYESAPEEQDDSNTVLGVSEAVGALGLAQGSRLEFADQEEKPLESTSGSDQVPGGMDRQRQIDLRRYARRR